MKSQTILIAGPTASGKSHLAMKKAREINGIIINADSMQVYSVLNLLSARPQPEDLKLVDHSLYGFVDPSVRYSTGAWLEAVEALLRQIEPSGRTPIFVGGTGLYFKALINGIAPVPKVAEEIVNQVSAEVLPLDRQQRMALLASRDPEMAAQLLEPDRQRVIRALSVLRATGRSLAQWQNDGHTGLLEGYETEKIVLNPDREVLRERIANRFEDMLQSGAVEEVRELNSLNLDSNLPAMKAIGVRQISDWLAGNISREEAVENAVTATRQYAKRQRTWFRKHMKDWEWRTS